MTQGPFKGLIGGYIGLSGLGVIGRKEILSIVEEQGREYGQRMEAGAWKVDARA